MRRPEDIVNELCFAIFRAHEAIKLSDILIYSSNTSNSAKYSYHIVVNNWYHENSREAKQFYNMVMGEMLPDLAKLVDYSVYKPVQQFRMLYNTKPEEERYKVRIKRWNYYGEEVTSEERSEYKEFCISLLSNIKKCAKLILPEQFDGVMGGLQPDISKYPELEVLQRLVPKEYVIDMKTGKKAYGYRLLRVSKGSVCIICQRPHGTDSKGDNARLFVQENRVYLACFRDETKTPYLLDTLDSDKVEAEDRTHAIAAKIKSNPLVPLYVEPPITINTLLDLAARSRNKSIMSAGAS
jgi:hypothetical protein